MSDGVQYVRWCNVYFEIEGGRTIVATCFNHDGLQAEVPGESQIVSSRQPQVVGEAALRALADCRFEPEFNYRDRKRADWPAFQLSDERSIQQFERRWRCLHVRGANERNITWELSAPTGRDFSLSLALSVAPAGDSRRLGEALVFLNDEVERFVVR